MKSKYVIVIVLLIGLITTCTPQPTPEPTSTATNTPIPTDTVFPSSTPVPTNTPSPSPTPTPQLLADTIEVSKCVANENSDQKTFEELLSSLVPYLNEMESYRYHTVYKYQVEGEYSEDALSVEISGAHSGRIPAPVNASDPDTPKLPVDLYEQSQVKQIDLRTRIQEEVIVNSQGFWARVAGEQGWIEFVGASPGELLLLPDTFSPQSIGTGIYGFFTTSEQPPLMSQTEDISGQDVIHRCWVYPFDDYGYDDVVFLVPETFTSVEGVAAATPLIDVEVHLWTSDDDTQFIRLAITGSHMGACFNWEYCFEHDVPRTMLLWMELFEIGSAIAIKAPGDEQIVLKVPTTSDESIGELSTPINELPLPADASVTNKYGYFFADPRSETVGQEATKTDSREWPDKEPLEYLMASSAFIERLMAEYASPDWHHTPANRWPTYQTDKSFSETARFYLEEMSIRGWQLKGRSLQLGMPELFLFFEREDAVMSIFLTPDGTGGAYISDILPPSMEVSEAVMTGWTEYSPGNSGLSDDGIDDIAIDQGGRVWITSDSGLDVLDGNEWSHHDRGGGYVAPVKVDWDGNVWVTSRGGLEKFDAQEWKSIDIEEEYGRVYKIFIDPPDKIWVSLEGRSTERNGLGLLEGSKFTYFANREIGFRSSHIVTSLVRDPRGEVWISTDSEGLFVYDGNDWRTVQNPTCPPFYGECYENDMLIDQQGWLWINQPGEMLVYDGKEWGRYTINSGLPYANIGKIAVDQHNRIWATSDHGCLSVLETDGQWVTYTPSPSPQRCNIKTIQVDPQGKIWLGTRDSVLVFDPPGPSSTQIRAFPVQTTMPPAPLQEPQTGWTRYTMENTILESNKVNCLVVDDEDRVWIGTEWGLSVFFSDGSQTTYTPTNSPLPDERISTLTIDHQDRIWIGTKNGLARLDSDGTWTLFMLNEGVWFPVEEMQNGGWVRIEMLVLDNEERLWMIYETNSIDSAISVMDEDGNWNKFISGNFGLPDEGIYTLAFDDEGHIWAETYDSDGIDLFGADGLMMTITRSELGVTGEYEGVTEIVFDDETDRLWIGTNTGLVVRDPDGSLTKYTTSNSNLISDWIQTLLIDSQGRIWIGTEWGLSILETDGTWTNHPSGNALLPLGGITDLAIDQQGRVWAGTWWGVSVYVP
jgi:ligand-binding sensor domain-containing protein